MSESIFQQRFIKKKKKKAIKSSKVVRLLQWGA